VLIRQAARKYHSHSEAPQSSRVLDVLSHATKFSAGCYCDDEARCHRSVLRELLRERKAKVV
jgi:uncharacterized protein YeaO (DUF488 family)